MPNTREKLIELLECTFGQVSDRDYDCYGECKTCQAEHLISNGVGFLPKWIPVTERLPDNGTYVNVATDGVVVPAYWHNDRFYAFTANGVATVGGVTHWMPLPQPPKGE